METTYVKTKIVLLLGLVAKIKCKTKVVAGCGGAVIPALGGLRQEDHQEFDKVRLFFKEKVDIFPPKVETKGFLTLKSFIHLGIKLPNLTQAILHLNTLISRNVYVYLRVKFVPPRSKHKLLVGF